MINPKEVTAEVSEVTTKHVSVQGLFVTLNPSGSAVVIAPNVSMSWTKAQVEAVAKLFSEVVVEENQ